MNRDEAKSILLLYRSSADAADPQMAEALALAKQDPELARWLEHYAAGQEQVRSQFRAIQPPPALKEQIISEHAARSKAKTRRDRVVSLAAIAAIIVAFVFMGHFWSNQPKYETVSNSLENYQVRMVSIANAGYAMDFTSGDLAQIQSYLSQQKAPADYALPGPLQKATATGCAVQDWDGKKVSMICFATGKPLPVGQPGDLWLFVADRSSIQQATTASTPQFRQVGTIITATWSQGDKVYFLGTAGDESTIRQYL
ncbi:MAG TPA: hypothetical protein VN625_02285 [Desulfuromonadaceae bacterium]|nr:hypothetical protein [Desulfuromonadaceae bacterium]